MIYKIKFLILNFVFVISYSQQYPQSENNIKNENLDKFVGNWIWSNNDESLEFILKKDNVKYLPNVEIYGDILYGFHQYKLGGKVIETSLQNIDTSFSDKKMTIIANSRKSSNLLIGNIIHLSKNKTVEFEIEYIDNNKIKLIKLKNNQGIRVRKNNKQKFDYSISLPDNIILIRK